MAKKQYFGIKYPFQNENEKSFYVDLNTTYEDKIKSEILHIIFTPKGQRYRNPDFGTDLVKYLFEPNDEETWANIKSEIKGQISKYLPNVEFNNIDLYSDDETGHHLYASISYSVRKGDYIMNDNIEIKVQ